MGFTDLFRRKYPLIGMVHLPPLPGSPRYAGRMSTVLRRAERDAVRAGFKGYCERFGVAGEAA